MIEPTHNQTMRAAGFVAVVILLYFSKGWFL